MTEEIRKVSDLTLEQFQGMIAHAVDQARKGDENGNPALRDLSITDFQLLINQVLQSRALAGAAKERDIAEKVMQDWQALCNLEFSSITSPARVSSERDVDELAKSMKEYFAQGGRGEMVYVVVIANANGTYMSAPQAKLSGAVKGR